MDPEDVEGNEEGKGAPQSMRKVRDEEKEVRGGRKSIGKARRDLRQPEERRRAQEDGAEEVWMRQERSSAS